MKEPAILSAENLDVAAKGLKAVAHPERLRILCHLQNREATVTELVELTKMSQSAVSQHLAKMKAFGVLTDRRDGNRAFYSVAKKSFEGLVSALCDIYEEPQSNKTAKKNK